MCELETCELTLYIEKLRARQSQYHYSPNRRATWLQQKGEQKILLAIVLTTYWYNMGNKNSVSEEVASWAIREALADVLLLFQDKILQYRKWKTRVTNPEKLLHSRQLRNQRESEG